ncbi:MAG: TIGR02266 family protein [Myxococcota bacterium]|nr:TIGR02266 family protein [Myxococcota bacterium]
MTDSAQKRGNQRVDVTLKVQLQYPDRDTFVERFSINVSRTGLFIRARDPAPVGSRVRFEYRLKDDSRIFRGTGVVRWARGAADAKEPDSPPGMGIEFVDLDPQSEDLVTHIVKTRGEGERAPRKSVAAPAKPKASARANKTVLAELGADEEESLLAGLAEAIDKPASEPLLELDLPLTLDEPAVEISRPKAQAKAAPHVIFDLAGPSILATLSMPNEGRPTDRFDERKLALTLGMTDSTLAIGGDGLAVPGLFAWADTRRSARVQLFANKLGLTLVADDNGRPALAVQGTPVALTEIAAAAARHTLQAYADHIGRAPVFRVILPASRSAAIDAELRAAFDRNDSLEFVDDIVALAARVSQDNAVVIAVSGVETRVGRVRDGRRDAYVAAGDCGIWDADAAVQAATARTLLKDHGIDVDDDPSLRQALAKQVELARNAEDSDFEVSIAGASVTMDAAAIDRALFPLAARIAVAVDTVDDAPTTVLWASDEPVWAALSAAVQSLLGGELSKLEPSAWVRLG